MSRKSKKKFRLPRAISLLVLVAGTSQARAQYVDWFPEQATPDWSYLRPRLRDIDMDMEYESDSDRSATGDLRTERWYFSPTAGIEWDNYIYHPYLLTYSLLFEPGYVWQKSGSPGSMTESDELMLNGIFKANILSVKPYATTLSYTRSHEEVKYDFFDSATVDSQGWGVFTGYRDGPVPVDLSFNQSQDDSTGINQSSTTDQTTINLHAKNDRQKDDSTDLTYQFGEFDRDTDVSGFSYSDVSSYNHLTLRDTENFRKSTLRSSLMFDEDESQSSSSSDLNAALDYEVEHTPHLHGDYDYTFSQYAGNGSDSIQNSASAGIHHQLYDSLTSSLQIQGSQSDSSSPGSTLDSYSGGITGSADYTKRLGGWGQLSLGENASYTLTDQQVTGSQLLVANESHVVPNNGLVILNQPREISITSVMDSTGTITLQPGLDYTVNQTTDPWQIQIISTGPNHISPGATIQVTYTVTSNPSGSYSVFANQAQITLSFWGNHADVFARYNFTDNQASSPSFLLQNDKEFQIGADLNWRGFSLHGDYTDDHSTLYDNVTYNLAENYSMSASAHSQIGINLNQQWSNYSFNSTSGNQKQSSTFYNAMLFLDWRPTSHLSWHNEAGFQRQRGSGLEQDLFSARSYLNWTVGKLEVHLGYEHEDQNFTSETRTKDYVFLRIRRNF